MLRLLTSSIQMVDFVVVIVAVTVVIVSSVVQKCFTFHSHLILPINSRLRALTSSIYVIAAISIVSCFEMQMLFRHGNVPCGTSINVSRSLESLIKYLHSLPVISVHSVVSADQLITLHDSSGGPQLGFFAVAWHNNFSSRNDFHL